MPITLTWRNPATPFEKIQVFRHNAPFDVHTQATMIGEISNGAESYVDPVSSGSYYYRVGTFSAGSVALSNLAYKTAGGAWSPKDLFINNRKGFFFDFMDKATLFADMFGTYPANNQVRFVRDLSGNNNHMRLASVLFSQSKPSPSSYNLYQNGGLKMRSGSVTGGLQLSDLFVVGTDGGGAYVSGLIKTPPTIGAISQGYNMSDQVFTAYNSGNGVDFVFGYADGTFSIYLEPNISTSPYLRAPTPTATNTNIVISAETNTTGTKMYLDGQMVAQSAAFTANPRLDGIGAYNGLHSFNGTVYAALAVFDTLTTEEKQNVDQWMAQRLQLTNQNEATP